MNIAHSVDNIYCCSCAFAEETFCSSWGDACINVWLECVSTSCLSWIIRLQSVLSTCQMPSWCFFQIRHLSDLHNTHKWHQNRGPNVLTVSSLRCRCIYSQVCERNDTKSKYKCTKIIQQVACQVSDVKNQIDIPVREVHRRDTGLGPVHVNGGQWNKARQTNFSVDSQNYSSLEGRLALS